MKKPLKMKEGSDRPYHFPEFPIKILKEIPNDYVNQSNPKDYLTKYPTKKTNHTLSYRCYEFFWIKFRINFQQHTRIFMTTHKLNSRQIKLSDLEHLRDCCSS